MNFDVTRYGKIQENFEKSGNYRMAVRFGDAGLKRKLADLADSHRKRLMKSATDLLLKAKTPAFYAII
jgi:hypothetical protein